MYKNYFLVAWRSFLKKKTFSAINLLGISFGLCFALLAILFIQDEFSFDGFHKNKDLIYRVESFKVRDGQAENTRSTSFPLPFAPTLKENVTGIDFITRYDEVDCSVRADNQQFKETVHYIDADFFSMFTLTFIDGNKNAALKNVSEIVISETESIKLFGSTKVAGRTIEIENKPYVVSGVFKNFPHNSSFDINLFLRYEEFHAYQKQHDDWGAWYSSVFAQLSHTANPTTLQKPLENFCDKFLKRGHSKKLSTNLALTPLTKMHFKTDVSWLRVSDIKYSYILGSIALVILLVACMNYILLSISGSLSRAKEIGVRKVIGATHQMIRLQFFSESIVIISFALPVSFLILQFMLPEFNDFMGRQLSLFNSVSSWLIYLVLLVLLTSIIAGGYPALILSRLKPERILKTNASGNYKSKVTNVLIVFQFTICFVLLVSAYIMFDQLKMIEARNLGFNKDQVIIIDTENNLNIKPRRILANYRSAFDNDQDILSISAVSNFGRISSTASSTDSTGKTLTEYFAGVDFDFFEMLEIPLVEGRLFSKNILADTLNRYVVNETFAKQNLGGGSVVGRSIPNSRGTEIIGVVKDFNFQSLENEIKPFAFRMGRYYTQLLVKVRPGNIPTTIDKLEKCWSKVVGDGKLKFTFLDDQINQQYKRYEQWTRVISVSSFLALAIALLGLFGTINLTILNRTKEIGIRKVLGATVTSIIGLFSKQYVVLIFVGFLVAVPISQYLLPQWLQNFAYKTVIRFEHYSVPLVAILLIASVVLATQILKKAILNPVESIRHE